MTRFKRDDSKIVFSSDDGDQRKKDLPGNDAPDDGDGIVRVRRETKGRKGKGVTTITGLPLDRSGLATLVKELKRRCGTGGTVKDAVIEMQGDHRDVVAAELEKRGYTVKLAGG